MARECRVNMSRNGNEDDYERLKRKFCRLWNVSSDKPRALYMVLKDPDKPCISDVVNSQRQLEDIKCIEDLLKILEQRNALSHEKPHLLRTIALYCISPTDKDWTFEAKSMVTKYMNDHNIKPNLEDTFVPVILNYKNVQDVSQSPEIEPAAALQLAVSQNQIDQEELFLDNCLRYLSSKFGTIGIRWPQFLRALPSINEQRIQTFRSRKKSAEAFVDCLEHWKLISPPAERNRATLIKAANACELREIADGLLAC